MINGIIYKYTSPSGKVYIGQTHSEKGRRQRWYDLSKPYAGPKINNARAKYGPENFEYEILFKMETENEDDLIKALNHYERYFIRQYNSIENGYNLDEGGIYVKLTKEQVQKGVEKRKKAILAYDLDGQFIGEYDSAKDAENSLQISASSICNVLKGKRKQSKGYIFKYKTDSEQNHTIDLSEHARPSKPRVRQYTLDGKLIQTFNSVTAASKFVGINDNQFRLYLKGKNNNIYKGFIWRVA